MAHGELRCDVPITGGVDIDCFIRVRDRACVHLCVCVCINSCCVWVLGLREN